MPGSITIRTPGRICLYGDHQDYLGLPVIACAIDRYITLEAKPAREAVLHIDLPDLKKQRAIPLTEEFERLEAGDHFGSGIRVVRHMGVIPEKGYHVKISGDLPINAGVSSSSAVMVAWMHFLLVAYGEDDLDHVRLGQLAYRAEVVEHHSPGGNMDQLTIACGGMVHIDTRGEGSVTPLVPPTMGMVLGVSGIPKKTLGTLGSAREMAQQATKLIQAHHPDFELAGCTPMDIPKYAALLPEILSDTFEAAVRNHHITAAALHELNQPQPNPKVLGALMSDHHAQLRDKLGLSTPLIEQMIAASVESGAFGAKIVGSGGGGCVVAICDPDKTKTIAQAMKTAGAMNAFPVQISKGSKLL